MTLILSLLYKAERVDIQADPLWTFGQLRELAARHFGLATDACYLRFRGRRVDENSPLMTSGVKSGASVVVCESEAHREHVANASAAHVHAPPATASHAAAHASSHGPPHTHTHATGPGDSHAHAHAGTHQEAHATSTSSSRSRSSSHSQRQQGGSGASDHPSPRAAPGPAHGSAPSSPAPPPGASPARPQPTVLEVIAAVGNDVNALEAEVRKLEGERRPQEQQGPLRKSAAICVETLTQKMLRLDDLEVDSETRVERKKLLTRILAVIDRAEALLK